MPQKLTILVVDDNDEFCQNVKDVLELEDYQVTTARDGFQSLLILKQREFDLVLMDLRMPVMDGVETFKIVKEMSPNTSVIMVTAFIGDDLNKEALQAGARAVLGKPMDFDKLLALIRQIIAQRSTDTGGGR